MSSNVKAGELFERWISQQLPSSPGPPPVPERDPLQSLPDFNVYSAEAPGMQPPQQQDATDAQQSPSFDSPRGRRASTESGVSAATSASAKRMNVIQEAMAGNGTRRAFKSPDGKVQIKLTSFRAPGGVDATTPYITAVVNPRSKSPAAVLTAAQKKKQEDDYVRAIVAANRKAAEERVTAERTRRRSTSSCTPSKPAPAATQAGSTSSSAGKNGVAGRDRGQSPAKAKGMHIAPAERERRPSISPNRYRPIGELDLFRVEAHSPARERPRISFQSFVRVKIHVL